MIVVNSSLKKKMFSFNTAYDPQTDDQVYITGCLKNTYLAVNNCTH